jgi:hypothetical protein
VGKRLAALEVPFKSLRRPHAVIAAWVADHASRVADSKREQLGLSALSGFILKQKLMGYPKKNGDILGRWLDFSFFFSRGNLCFDE